MTHADSVGLSKFLRSQTRERHTQAEREPGAQRFANARIGPEDYAHFLHHCALIHRELDPAVREAWPGLAVGYRGDLQDRIRADLEDLAISDPRAIRAVDAATEIQEQIAEWRRTQDAAIVGAAYTWYGSQNGGRILARALRPFFPTRYLDPGPEFPHNWSIFTSRLDELELLRDRCLTGAERAFDWASQIYATLPSECTDS
jgi:heme oxygenase